jgi:hypothetical protein
MTFEVPSCGLTIESVEAGTTRTNCCSFGPTDKSTNSGASCNNRCRPSFATKLRFMSMTMRLTLG